MSSLNISNNSDYSYSSRALNIGLFGYGTVGKGLYTVLQRTPSLTATVSKIVIKDLSKERNLPAHFFSDEADYILKDDAINVVVELISDAEAAYRIVCTALQKGKYVVSANKKMIAAHLEELLALQQEYGGILLYEGACCASIPIIRNLEEYYDNDMLQSLCGVVNGSTNYILSRMAQHNETLEEALLPAQQLGFAELDPSLDVEGHDAANKLSILLTHAFGIIESPANLLYTGIQNISTKDMELAEEKKLKIKLVAQVNRLANGNVSAYVLPQYVRATDELYNVSNEFNGIVTESSFADRQFFKGKGAGAFPTASAVLSDIAALRYDYKYAYRKLNSTNDVAISYDYYLKVSVSSVEENAIPQEAFEVIEEIYKGREFIRYIGYISAQKLQESDWWRSAGVSLVSFAPAESENIERRKITQKNLELAEMV